MSGYWIQKRKQLCQIAISLAVVACLLFSVPATALAAEAVDTTKICSISLYCHYEGTPLAGMGLRVYRVADGTLDAGFKLSGAFSTLPVSLSGLDNAGWSLAASTLATYIQPNGISATSSATADANGYVNFSGLSVGLYLVVGDTLKIGNQSYSFAPFFVALPSASKTGSWLYDVSAYPKPTQTTDHTPNYFDLTVLLQWVDGGSTNLRPLRVGIRLMRNGVLYDSYTLAADANWRQIWTGLSDEYTWTVIQTTDVANYTVTYQGSGNVLVITDTNASAVAASNTTTQDSSIPLTGLLWWPVYVMAAAGIVLFIMGWRKRYGQREERHEA